MAKAVSKARTKTTKKSGTKAATVAAGTIDRSKASVLVLTVLSHWFSLPPSYFAEDDDLRTDWLFTDASLVELGKALNRSEIHPALITPIEMVRCGTIADLINLVDSKR
jgi:hypothetical protein